MLALLLARAACYFPFEAPVVEGTTDNWVDEVSEFVQNSGVCFVMFVQKRSPRCKAIFEDFQEAANRSLGMVKYVSVDLKEHPKIAHLYTVRAVPAFRLVHPKGVKEYKGDTSADSLVDAALRLIPNKARVADETWVPSPTTPLSALLLTNRKTVPPFWAAISCRAEHFRVGFTRSPQLMAQIAPAGALAFIYKDIVAVYDGPLTYTDVTAAMHAFEVDPKASGAAVSLVAEVSTRDQFHQLCRNTGRICVFEVGPSTPGFDDIARLNHHGPFRFLRCSDKCPFPDMSRYVVFHGKRDTLISIEDVSDLPAALDRIIDGGAKWAPFPSKFNEEL